MSRIGKAPISVPDGVTVEVSAGAVKVSSKQGELSQEIPDGIQVEVQDTAVAVTRTDDSRQQRSLHGLTRALVNNMVEGVTNGFMKEAPEGVTFDVPEPTIIKVSGIDKQLVGQVAADIRALKKPEPYKGKGIRYVGEHVIRKAGKSAK